MTAVLVTGATGFLGGVLCRKLHQQGITAIGLGRNPQSLRDLARDGITAVACDLTQPIAGPILQQIGPVTKLVHCAALSSPWGKLADFEAANVRATRHIMAAAHHLGVRRFVHISTPSVYFRFADQELVPETQSLPNPVNAYARTKRQAEQIVLAEPALGPIILRPRGIYGAGDTALLPRLMRAAETSRLPRFWGGMGATDITHVDDVVDAILLGLQTGTDAEGEIYNISGGEALGLQDIITSASARAGITPRWRSLPFGAALAAVRGAEQVAARLPGYPEPPVTAYGLGILRYRQTLNIEKAAAGLGWHPKVSFQEGLLRSFGEINPAKGQG